MKMVAIPDEELDLLVTTVDRAISRGDRGDVAGGDGGVGFPTPGGVPAALARGGREGMGIGGDILPPPISGATEPASALLTSRQKHAAVPEGDSLLGEIAMGWPESAVCPRSGREV